jgi:hypothetical protein
MFDVTLPLVIEDGTDEELRKRFVPYVTDAGAYEVDRRDRAREAISEMAPPFLEKTILGFAKDIYSARLAVEGLGRVQTPESRADLIELFDRSTDLQLRFLIVQTLAEIGTTGELAFFTSMLPGRSNQLDDQMRVYAAWGLGRVGGERAVQALSNAPPSPNPYVRSAVVVALGNTKSREAVPALLQMYRDEGVRSAVCGALLTMTHYRWCDGSGDVDSKVRRWQQWWSSHGAGLRLHGPAECPPFRAILPSVDGPAVLPVPK